MYRKNKISWTKWIEEDSLAGCELIPILPNEVLVNIMSFMTVKEFISILNIDIYKPFDIHYCIWEDIAHRELSPFCNYKPINKNWEWFCKSIFSVAIFNADGHIVCKYDNISEDLEMMVINILNSIENGDLQINNFSCIDGEIIYDINYDFLIDYDEICNYLYEISLYNGTFYQGCVLEGEKDGIGTKRFRNGNIYEGEWKNNRVNGNGKYTYNNGDILIGTFTNGVIHGRGKYFWDGGDVYKGHFVQGKFNGYGTLKYNNGLLFKGNFENDVKSGKGTLIWPDGDRYEGEWENDVRLGEGVLYSLEGNIEQYWDGTESPLYYLIIPDKR